MTLVVAEPFQEVVGPFQEVVAPSQVVDTLYLVALNQDRAAPVERYNRKYKLLQLLKVRQLSKYLLFARSILYIVIASV